MRNSIYSDAEKCKRVVLKLGDFQKYSTIFVTSLFTIELCSVDQNHSQQSMCAYTIQIGMIRGHWSSNENSNPNIFMVQSSCFE